VPENIYDLLHQALQATHESDTSSFGVDIGIVTNVQDPEKQGRVKICFPRLPGKPEGDWARVAQPSAGDGRGFYWLPQVGDEVLVAFERGQTSYPFVIGCLWNGQDQPPDGSYTDDNSLRVIQTRSGHQIVLSDKDGEETIVVSDKTGKRVITFDVKAKKFLVEASEGDVEISAEKKLLLQCEDLEINTSKSAKIKAQSFDLKVSSKAQIKASSRLDLKAAKIDINPSAGGGGGGGGGAAAAAARAAARAVAAAVAAAAKESGAQARGADGGGAGGGAGGDLSSDVAPSGGSGGPAESDKAEKEAKEEAGKEETPVAADEIDIQLVNVAGTPQKKLEVELTLPDGNIRAGKTDDNGHFKLSGLAAKGKAKLDVPDVQSAPQADPSVAGRVRFVKDGVDVEIGKATVVELPPQARRCRLSGLNFDTNKTFLLPEAMTGIRQLVKLYKSFEGIEGLVDGHTDKQPPKSGDSFEFNRKLSVERAESIAAYLTDDAEAWQKFYAGTGASGKWGVREDQIMLKTVKDADGNVFYDGDIDGIVGTKTKEAYHKFQRSRLLDEQDTAAPEMRLELVRAYMALDGTSLPTGTKLQIHGCGLTHPLPGTESNPDPNQPTNRRVEVYLFDGAVDPPPVEREPPGGCEEHAKWVGQMVLDVDLDQPPGNLKVTVFNEDRSARIPGAQVHISGPLALDATTDRDGVAVDSAGKPPFDELIPGGYKVIAEADGFFGDFAGVNVRSGLNGEIDLKLKAETFALDVLVQDQATPPNKLEGAKVTIDAPGAKEQTTGADGLAHFLNVPQGKFKVSATHDRFEPGSISVDVPLRAPPTTDTSSGLVKAPGQAQGKPPVLVLTPAPPFLRFETLGGAPLLGVIRPFAGGKPLTPTLKLDGKLPLADLPASADRFELAVDQQSLDLLKQPRTGAPEEPGHYLITRPDGTLHIAGQFEDGKIELRQKPAADPANPKADWIVRGHSLSERRAGREGAGFQKVKHWFVLVMENRSFDHMLGHNDKLIEADTIKDRKKKGIVDFNEVAGGPRAEATDNAEHELLVDPGHELEDTRFELFQNDKANLDDLTQVPTMKGFLEAYFNRVSGKEKSLSAGERKKIADKLAAHKVKPEDWAAQVMAGFKPEKLPVINELAVHYAVCDRWFSGLPGPTSPSRLFFHAGSSAGLDDSPTSVESARFVKIKGISFDKGTIFDTFKAAQSKGLLARVYVVSDIGIHGSQVQYIQGVGPLVGGVVAVRQTPDGLKNHFDADELKGKQGSYTFIEPDYGTVSKMATGGVTEYYSDGESQHPPGDLRKGELLIRDVFNAIFGQGSPIRNESALIITYDEHGGLFDHVPPPAAVQVTNKTEPSLNKQGFKFSRLGVRVPAVIASPLISKNVVDHTVYDPTAVLRTLQLRFGLPSLTDRDRQAADFAHLFRLETPRTDLPTLAALSPPEKVTAVVAEPRPEELDTPVSLEVLPFLSVLAMDVIRRVPEREADVLRRLEEVKTVRDALDFDADMREAPIDVAVRVTGPDGSSVLGAQVKLEFATAHEGRTSDGSDGQEKGTVRFKGVIPGKYTARAQHEGFDLLTTAVTARGGGEKAALGIAGPAGGGGVLLQLKLTQPAKVQLAVQLRTIFSLQGNPAARWTGAGAHPDMLKDAQVSIDGGTAVKTNAAGRAVLDITALAPGKHTLRVEPDASKRSRGPPPPPARPADPPVLLNGPAGPELSFGAANDPGFMFRPIAIEIETDASGLKNVVLPAPRFATLGTKRLRLADHFIVLSFTAKDVAIDWKPDWMKSQSQFHLATRRDPKVLVVHQTAGFIEGDIQALVFGSVSAHYLVDVDGHVIKLVHESNVSAHVGGGAKWMGIGGLPMVSIGIEQTHRDVDDTVKPPVRREFPFPDEQVFATRSTAAAIRRSRPTIIRQAVAGHGEVEFPARGLGDPGPTFEWNMLERAGEARTRNTSLVIPATIYGIGPTDPPIKAGRRASPEIGELQRDLKTIGYDFAFTANSYDAGTITAVDRFQVRFWSGSLAVARPAWAANTVFTLDDRVVNGGNVYRCTTAGKSAASGGPSGTGDGISDGGAVWDFDHVDVGARPKSGEVDFATAKAIKQVLADAPATVTVNVTPPTPPPPPPPPPPTRSSLVEAAPGAAPDDDTSTFAGDGAREPVPILPGAAVHAGEAVEVSWSIDGEFDRLVLDPGSIDVTDRTKRSGRKGTGSLSVQMRREDAVDDAVPLVVTAFAESGGQPDPVAAGGAGGSNLGLVVAVSRTLMNLKPPPAPTDAHCIPARTNPAMTGTAFMQSVANVKSQIDRDNAALAEFFAGNIPDFLRNFVTVTVSMAGHTGKVFVAPDYLAIGTDADFVRIPLLPGNAQKVVSKFCCTLPTAKICDDIYASVATVRISPVSVPNFPGVQNGEVIKSNAAIQAALAGQPGYKLGDLTTGPKKDIVLSHFLKRLDLKGKQIGNTRHKHQSDDAVVIYGWHDPANKGKPIQDEFDGHDKTYEDYSHGIRLVSLQMILDGAPDTLFRVLKDPAVAALVYKAGDLKDPRNLPIPEKYP
jgi:phospholipase C